MLAVLGALQGQLGRIWPLYFFPMLPTLQEGSWQQSLTG